MTARQGLQEENVRAEHELLDMSTHCGTRKPPPGLAMCSVLLGHGIPAADLLVLGPGAADPLGSAVVVATPAVRAMFGTGWPPCTHRRSWPASAPARPGSMCGPSPQTGLLPIGQPWRPICRRAGRAACSCWPIHGSASLRRPDAARRRQRGRASADHGGRAGRRRTGADPRVRRRRARVELGTPLRTAELVAPERTAQAMLAFVRAQHPPYRPARSSLSHGPDGQWTLTIQFTAPSLLGLLAG